MHRGCTGSIITSLYRNSDFDRFCRKNAVKLRENLVI